MEPTEKIHRPLKTMLWQNFLGGIAWSLGVTLGLTFLFAIIGFIISHINFVPIVGKFISDIINFINQNRVTTKDIVPLK